LKFGIFLVLGIWLLEFLILIIKQIIMFKKIIPILFLLICSMTAFAQDNTLTEEEKKAGWKLLFDGKTLNGWRMYQNKSSEGWVAQNGQIACVGSATDKSDLRGDLVTTEQFDNFELSIDWKISPKGNSGIMYHVTENQKAAYYTGPEYQLVDDTGFPDHLDDVQKTASDYGMYAANPRPTKPVGEFNNTRIVVKGSHREYWLNGVKVVEFEAWSTDWNQRVASGKWKDYPEYGKAKQGHIVLQDHGSGVWFKNIKIRKL
jgi:Domain of Unknown Function (DUF1080)